MKVDLDVYSKIDELFKQRTALDIGFNALISSQPYKLNSEIVEGFCSRYQTIKRFQQISLDLFRQSLAGELNPAIAQLVLNELPIHMGKPYHSQLSDAHFTTPVFFRTDETIPGKILEIQCPGSLWGEYALLEEFYSTPGSCFAPSVAQAPRLSEKLSSALSNYIGKQPIIHHLLDNASLPHSLVFFIQTTRSRLKYWAYDKGVKPLDCNFIRSHSFHGLVAQDFHQLRLSECAEGRLFFDHPPIPLFDQKISLLFPFWEETYQYYDDEIRSIFPFTQLISPQGFQMEDGSRITIQQFCELPRKRRDYFIKYAGTNSLINWGSRGVYYAGMLSRTACDELMNRIVEGFAKNEFWLIQPAIDHKEKITYLTRSNDDIETEARTKFSGFYGPAGFLGAMVMHRSFRKVHGSDETVINICFQ